MIPIANWRLTLAVPLAFFCMAVAAQQAPSFPGRVQKVGGTGLGHVTVRIEGAGSTSTSDSGEFSFPFSGILKVGYPAIFHVTNWVILKPCELKNGRTYLHDPVAEPIEILVLPPHDPRLLSVAESGSLIDCIIEEESSQIAPKSSTNAGPRSSLSGEEHSPFQNPAHPNAIPSGIAANSDISRLHFVKAAYRSEPGRNSVAPPLPDSIDVEVPDRRGVLAAKAEELGISITELKSAIGVWKKSVESLYEKGLAALDDGRYEEAVRYISQSLASPDAEVLRNVPLAYAEYQQGLYPAAESALTKVLAVHPDDPIVMHNLGAVLIAAARYSEAELHIKHALAIDEDLQGPHSREVTTDLNNLAVIYDDQGKYDEAEPLLKRALAIDKKTLGRNSPVVAIRLSNLADLFAEEGNYGQAERLLQQALMIDRTTPGSDETAVASDFNNLAGVYFNENKLREAEPLSKRAFEIDERELGPNHPLIANDLNTLAVIYREQGKFDRAEPLFQRALTIEEKSLGPKHPDFARVIANLGILRRKKGDYGEAERLLKRALAIDENVLGQDHPGVAWDLNNLGSLYYDQRRFAEAEQVYMRALTIDEKSLAPKHPDLAEVEENLARALHRLGNDARAKQYEQRAKSIRNRRENSVR